MVAGDLNGNTGQPRPYTALTTKTIASTPGTQQRFLSDGFSQIRITGGVSRQPQDASAMQPCQLVDVIQFADRSYPLC